MILKHPRIILIIGRRGSGKTSCGYYIAEQINREYGVKICTFRHPNPKILPAKIKNYNEMDAVPNNCVLVADEAHLHFNARQPTKRDNINIGKLITGARQKNQSLVWITHNTARLDRNIISERDILIIKNPPVAWDFERRELRRLVLEATEEFAEIPEDERKRYAYEFSEDFIGLTSHPQASFWAEELSYAYANPATSGGGWNTVAQILKGFLAALLVIFGIYQMTKTNKKGGKDLIDIVSGGVSIAGGAVLGRDAIKKLWKKK